MNLPEIFQRRLQDYLRRYDKLAKAVGPLKAPQPNEVSREVAGLLILSANQCCVAAAIMDTAENVAITTPSAEPAVRVRMLDQHTHLSRRGKMVVVPGMGKSNFPFPDTDELVLRALMRLSGNDDQTEPGKGKAEKKRLTGSGSGSSEDPGGSAHKGERLTYIIAPMDFESIMRMPDHGIESTDSVRTPHRDLLFGRSTQPQVCFLRDAEKLVEQIPTRDGMYVLEFEVGPEDFLPDVLLDRAGEFLDRAEQFLSWAEALWPDTQPPMSAVALPPEEKRFLSAGAA